MKEQSLDDAGNCWQRERRTAGCRYDIALRARFTWQSPDGGQEEGCGTTENISSRGVWLSTSTPPPVGAAIEVLIDVPPLKCGTRLKCRLRGAGKVLRVSSEDCFAADVGFQLERLGALSKRSGRGSS